MYWWASDQIEDKINGICAAYYSFIYENLYHNLKNINTIPNKDKDEIYLITNKNTDQTAIYTKNFKLDPKEDITYLLVKTTHLLMHRNININMQMRIRSEV